MDPKAIVTGLARVAQRGPGTDAERRAGRWLADVLREDLGREARFETVWVRPQRAAVLALHALAGVIASVVAAFSPAPGLAIAAVALASWVLDQLGWAHLGRRLTPVRATQNLVSPPTAATRSGRDRSVRLVITAAYDAPRTGLAHREPIRRLVARARAATGGRLPGAAAWIALALAAVTALAGARWAGEDETWVGAVQLIPTIALLAALGLAVDAGLARTGPGAGDPASGAAVAIALAAVLDRDPPRHLGVELVLAGAGDGPSLGMQAFVRARRRRWRAEATAVLHMAACGRGRPRFWSSDGPLVPLRMHPRLRELAAATGALPLRGRGATAAWRARRARWPALALGCLPADAWPPDSGTPHDTAERVDPAAMQAALATGVALVRALDRDVGERLHDGAARSG